MTTETTQRPMSFFSLMWLAPGRLGIAIVTAILSAFLSLVPFWCLYKIAAELLAPVPDTDAALRWAFWAAAAILLRALTMGVSHSFAHLGAFSLQRSLRLRLCRHLGEVPLSFFGKHSSSSLRRVIHDGVGSFEGFFAHMLPDLVAAISVPPIALVLLFSADWRMALVSLIPLPLAIAAQMLMMRRGGEHMREWAELQRRIAEAIGEFIRGVHVFKSFGQAARSFSTFAEKVNAASDWVARYARSSSASWLVFSGLLSSSLLIVAPIGAWLHLRGSLDLPTYLLFLMVAPAVLLPLLRLTFAVGEQMQRQAILDQINRLLSEPPLPESSGTPVPDAPPHLQLEQVSYRYDSFTEDAPRHALTDVTLRADAGQLTAIVGPSGAGKSTVARLVSRLNDANEGRVLLGGVDVREWPIDALLRSVAVVFQEVHLFNGSVLDNLRLAAPDASIEQIESAARAARAHDFILALPQGYDTPLGERGARLSGGERQRLSIARALLKDAPVLVLDEATASTDSENEALIQQALAELCRNRTVLMIAHRLHTVVDADRIVVMDAGRVVDQGDHAALLERCPLYAQMWRDQTRAREWHFAPAGASL